MWRSATRDLSAYVSQVGVLLQWASAQVGAPQIAANCETHSLHVVKTNGNPKLTNEGMQGYDANINYAI